MAGRTSRSEPPARAAVSTWRERALLRRGFLADGWEDPSMVRLVHAACRRTGIGPAATAYGSARYLAGWTHAETLEDIEDLIAACPAIPAPDALAMMCGAATGWVDAMTAETVSLPHRDLLTGLPTTGFVVLASEPLYRGSGSCPSTTHSLVIVHLAPQIRGAARLAATLRLAEQARLAFGDQCTVASLGSLGVIVLIENTAANYRAALALPADGTPSPGLRVRLEPLPATFDDLEPQVARHARHRLPPAS